MKNPIYKIGNNRIDTVLPFRNHMCPEYDLCLTKAAIEDLFLDCSECGYKDRKVEICLYLWELRGCERLLEAVFGVWKPG